MNANKILAKTLYGEGRNQGERGMRAIATVIYNRAKGQRERFAGVCLKPKQFSCWNGVDNIIVSSAPADKQAYEICCAIVKEMMDDTFIPVDKKEKITFTHYCTVKLFNSTKCAEWIKQVKESGQPTVIIGDHIFMEAN